MKRRSTCFRFGLIGGLAMVLLAYAGAPLHAQIFDGQGVLQGKRVELGINACGVYAVNSATLAGLGSGPEGPFNNPVLAGLGAIYLNEPGDFPPVCGDYWFPGTPEESFGFQLGSGPVFKNGRADCGFNAIPGALYVYEDLGTVRRMTWRGVLHTDSVRLTIFQRTTLGTDARFFRTEVHITNSGSSAMEELYYARSMDPDNDHASSGFFTTTNRVITQADGSGTPSLIEAIGPAFGMCYLGLASADPRSRVALGISPGTFSLTNPSDAWHGINGYGASGIQPGDWSISIAFRVQNLMPGQTDTLRYVHVFEAEDVPLALAFDSVEACPTPASLSGVAAAERADLYWEGHATHIGYKLRGGAVGGSPFVKTTTNDSIRINGLTPSTAYQWKVRAKCSDGSESAYAPVQLFSTPALRGMAQASAFKVFPNPASGVFALSGETLPTYDRVRIIDMAGRLVQEVGLNGQSTLTLNAAGWNSGIYTVQLLGKGAPQYLRLQVR